MKIRRFFLITAVLLSGKTVFAESNTGSTINFFSPEKRSVTFESGLLISSGTDNRINSFGVDFGTCLDKKEFVTSAGIRFSSEQMNFTHETVYWPTINEKFNIGTGLIFHYCNYYSYFSEIDFLTGLYFRYDNLRFFTFDFSLLYMGKSASISAKSGNLPWLYNNDLGLKIAFGFRPFDKFSFNIKFASYSYYHYLLFFAPDTEFTVSYKLNDNVQAGLNLNIQYVDLFTLSSNFSSYTIRTFVKMEM